MIELQFFEKEDFQQLLSWIDSQDFLVQWAGTSMEFPLDEQQLEQYLSMSNSENAANLAYKVIYVESGKIIGHISLGTINRKNGTARMCRVLIGDKSLQGKGIGRLMVLALLKIAFEQLNLHKVSLAVYDFNEAAVNLYKKIGFKTEGFIREASKVGNDHWSYFEMSMLNREWQALNNVDAK
ncbi:GNAT family protein [Neobacillus novalis]|uniref:GNAT family protein n=1 Tax=Neobacillus novalis TaxID=220687 RepID=A0AA95MYJ9_9BACI|nr:GNAT family protein [Neobacillus novalis]WHY88518.1 GNAT family protein [Neobacillus novalis]